ncbi:hypothetical protein [Curtobacterium sp. Leaf261]|uniref:hypothetical protein n=1 Tax=Curtobacterium sp. Leaf261 TaxID=1736311 RepID=UPI000AC8AE7E|nr:hypothetical protein [Curtobacterium sp. Leaf261]
MKKILAMLTAVLAVASVLVGLSLAHSSSEQPAQALSGSSFDAGNIISDANFYDGGSLSTAAIQSFLSAQGGTCRSNSCLSNGRFSMNARGGDAMCSAVAGGSGLSTAQIISQVASACGISPKVMLVTLQKEQGLVTATNPSAATLQKAMGYACPDTGNGCDPAYAGVGNQMYWSAWQWKRYGNPAGTSAYFTWFNPGTHQIQYNVPTSCGTKTVTVANKATAALYYYTPYTPNTAALNNLYGTGDSCSAYGNRNFWRMYSDWFGDPSGRSTPIGSLDGLTAGVEQLSVRGWAMDGTANTSTFVDVYVDDRGTRLSANDSRPDVERAYPGRGALHGFDDTFPAATGSHQVCVYAVSADGQRNATLGCRSVYIQSGTPFGSVDTMRAVPGGIQVSGWAIDAETANPLTIRATVDGAATSVTAGNARADVGRAYPASGPNHGFSTTLAAAPGNHTVCLTGVNVGPKGADGLISPCRTVGVPTRDVFGSVDTMRLSGSTLTVGGWALDGSDVGPVTMKVTVDGSTRSFAATGTRADVGRSYPGWGPAHGFTTSYELGYGAHSVCVTAVGTKGASTQLRCATVTRSNTTPIGSFDGATATTGGIAVNGWAIDPDTTASIAVTVAVDATPTSLTANTKRADVGRAHPGFGDSHGWSSTIAAARGTHTVCATAIDSTGGTNPSLGCRTVVVP